LFTATLAAFVLLAGCTGNATPTPSLDPLALVTEAAANIRAAETFRISVTQEGPDYMLATEYGTAIFRSATAQYVAPREMQANVRVVVAGLPIQIDVFSRGADQWYRAIWTGNQWLNQPFQEGFDPETLVSEEAGFQSALDSLIELNYAGEAELDSGAQVYHLTATANGPDVTALLGGLIEPVGEVLVDVYIDRETRQPVRFIIQEFNSPFAATPEAGEDDIPIVWTIDLYDIDAPAELDAPQESTEIAPSEGLIGAPSRDSTAEATSEATPES
jgi:hypothetical protein